MLLHQPFHIVKGFVVNYMHMVLLGVVLEYFNLWLRIRELRPGWGGGFKQD